MSKSNPYNRLLNIMGDAIELDNDMLRDQRKFVRPWQRVYGTIGALSSIIGLIIAGRAGFGDGAIDIGTAVTAGLLVVGGAFMGVMSIGPGGGSKGGDKPRDLPPLGKTADDDDDE